ncbi:expressed unknown protein [Seminavis robusta]|uniref:Transcription factor Iwr1 domain-containing protein n=1 Tax=Seminavis robusta TaxID=568900 RepID=A0A9N8ELT8_9STRA|nr:expressed unknown protein [Seminavis robusta]|eukprot:Sro1368_g266770.1 n/a (456) ;mRNA; r:8254-9621
MSSSSPMMEQTLLRVKRRRNEHPPSTIRLELLGGWNRTNDENDSDGANSNNNNKTPLRSSSTATLADSRHSNMSTSTNQTQPVNNTSSSRYTTAAAVWKRVEVLDADGPAAAFTGEKRCRVVDAILEGDGRSTKRRKLTVLGEFKQDNNNTDNKTKKAKKSNIYKVLDPVTRLVDDSLNMVHSGDKTVGDHYNFITTDPRLATEARSHLLYRNRGGTLLHACAQWNDVETAHDLLRKSLPGMADAVDDDGRTPYETAQLCGHESIAGVLEAFGADTTNFVYDMFVPEEIQVVSATTSNNNNNAPQQLQSASTTNMSTDLEEEEEPWDPLKKSAVEPMGTSTTKSSNNGGNGNHPPTPDLSLVDTSRLLELQGGVGYWTEDGELILEVEHHHVVSAEYGHDSDDDYDEEDIDSNCEDYGGNDYPEDESWDQEFLHEEPDIEDDPYNPTTADEYDMW